MKKMITGESRTNEIPGALRITATKLNVWLRIQWERLSDGDIYWENKFTASNGVTIAGLQGPKTTGFYLSDNSAWNFGNPCTTNIAESNWKALVKALKEFEKEITPITQAKDDKHPETAGDNGRSMAELKAMVDCFGTYDKSCQECVEVCQINESCHFASVCDKVDQKVDRVLRKRGCKDNAEEVKEYPKKREEAIRRLLANSDSYTGIFQDPCYVCPSKDPGCLSWEVIESYDDGAPKKLFFGGRMYNSLFHHNGYHMVQTETTEWVPEENLLCVGIEPGTIELTNSDGEIVDTLVRAYEQQRVVVYRECNAYVHPADYYPEPEQKLVAKTAKKTEREQVRESLIDVMEYLNHEFDCDLRNAVEEMIENQEASARKLRALLEREKTEKRVMAHILESLKPVKREKDPEIFEENAPKELENLWYGGSKDDKPGPVES